MELPVEKILKIKKVSYRIIALNGVAITHQDVIKYAQGADPDDDCKTIMVKDSKGKIYALFLPGMMKVSFSALKQIVGSKVDILSVQELKQVTGKDRGAVCPILLKNIPILADKRVFSRVKAHFSSGDINFGLELTTKDLSKLMKFQIVDFAIPV